MFFHFLVDWFLLIVHLKIKIQSKFFLSYNISCYYLILYIFFTIYSVNGEHNETSDDNNNNTESEFSSSSSLSEDYFLTDDDNKDDNNEDDGSWVSIS